MRFVFPHVVVVGFTAAADDEDGDDDAFHFAFPMWWDNVFVCVNLFSYLYPPLPHVFMSKVKCKLQKKN